VLFRSHIDDPWAVQRLFSIFPRGAPGIALVLLRFAVAATLWTGGPLGCLSPAWMTLAWFLLAIPLCLGILTPALAVVCAVVHAASLACGYPELMPSTIVAIASASALAMLGPGAYSVDCRLFGRRVFVMSRGESP
jgi:hypothetical protein